MEHTPIIITSRQNAQVSLACKLGEKKHRQSERMFRFDGVKLFCEAVARGVEFAFILVDETQKESVNAKAKDLYGLCPDDANCRILYLSHELFVKISDENAPEGIICVAKYIDKLHKIATINSSEQVPEGRILLCESLRDPGNVGTVVRTAYAFGIDWLVFSDDCADLYNPKTLRGSMGTLFSQKILRVDDLAAAIEMMRAQEGWGGGYYSGIATIHEGRIYCRKVTGVLDRLLRTTDALDLPGTIAKGDPTCQLRYVRRKLFAGGKG